jgi:hypothetical protein
MGAPRLGGLDASGALRPGFETERLHKLALISARPAGAAVVRSHTLEQKGPAPGSEFR